MNKLNIKWLLLAMMLGIGAGGLTACEEGAFEEAGEEVDDAADEVGDEIN